MKRYLFCGILAATVVAAFEYRSRNQSVYALYIYSGGWSYGPSWQIGWSPFSIGCGIKREVGMPSEWGPAREIPTFTEFDFGNRSFIVRGDYYSWVGRLGLFAVAMAIACLFMFFATPERKK